MKRHRLIRLGIGLAVVGAFAAWADAPRIFTNNFTLKQVLDLEAKVIAAFNAEQCGPVLSLVPVDQYEILGPRATAVVAYCLADLSRSEALFARAEEGAPSDGLVVLLHARRVYRADPKRARGIFETALNLARTSYVRLMAKSFLEGVGNDSEPVLVGSHWHLFLSVQGKGGYETNPETLLYGSQTAPSPLGQIYFAAGAVRALGRLALGANYLLSWSQFFAVPADNLLQNDLDLPIIIPVGSQEDLRVIPFGEEKLLAASPYYLAGGLRVAGIAYHGNYRQTVQGALFQDYYNNLSLNEQAGQHFRFDYLWELYPVDWYLAFETYIEHVQAGRQSARVPYLNIPYSHNDIGLKGSVEYDLKRCLVGINTGLLFRLDDLDSKYAVGGSPMTTDKRREDLTFLVEPTLTVPLSRSVQLTSSFRFLHTFSNIGPNDYQDLSVDDVMATAGVKVYLENL